MAGAGDLRHRVEVQAELKEPQRLPLAHDSASVWLQPHV